MPTPARHVPVTLIAAPGLLLGCTARDRFDIQNARAHVECLTAGGSRTTPTEVVVAMGLVQ